jgi:hypothetical protein
LRDTSAEVFWSFDEQQRSTLWSCADPREGINPIMAQIPMLSDGCWMMRPKMMSAVLQLANGGQVCGCAHTERRRHLALEHQNRWTKIAGTTAGTKQKWKAEVCGGRRDLSSPRGVPSFLCGGRPAGDEMV